MLQDVKKTLIFTGSYAAWLRNDGDWYTETEKYRNWNMEVMRDMSADIEPPWDDLLSDIRTHHLNLKQCLGAYWDEAIVALGSSSSKSLIKLQSSNICCPNRIRVAHFKRSG